MQTRQIRLLPAARRRANATTVEVQQEYPLSRIDLHIVGVEICMPDPGAMKARDALADPGPCFCRPALVRKPCGKRLDVRKTRGDQISPVNEA